MEKLNDWMTLIANVGVLAGIVFLAYEIQVNTNAVRSSTYVAYAELADSWSDFYAEHAVEISAIEEHDALEQLTPAQTKVYAALAAKSFNQMETTYLNHRAGSLDDDVFDARMANFERYVEQTPLLWEWWQIGRSGRTEGFRELMEGRIASLRVE